MNREVIDSFYLPVEMQKRIRETLEPLVNYLAERYLPGQNIQMNVQGHNVTIEL